MKVESAPSVVVGYVVVFDCEGSTTTQLNDMYSSLMTQLNTAVSNGDLTAAINSQAVTYNATALASAVATVEPAATPPVVINYYSPSPTKSPVSTVGSSLSNAVDLGKLSAAVYVVVGVVAITLAGAVFWKRSVLEQGKLAVLPWVSTASGLCLSAFVFAANIALAVHLLSGSESAKIVAALLLVVRAVYFAFGLFALVHSVSSNAKLLLCPVSLSQNGGMLGTVCCLLLFHCEGLKYLPWQRSDFSDLTGGYASLWMMQACTYSSVVLSFVVAGLSVGALSVSKHLTEQDKAAGSVSLIASLLLIVVTCVSKYQSHGLVASSKLNDVLTSGRTESRDAESIAAKEDINSTFQPPVFSSSSAARHSQNPILAARSNNSLNTSSNKSYELSVSSKSVAANSSSGSVVNQIIAEVLKTGDSSSQK
jgi:FtsH-binding integral membrane protein